MTASSPITADDLVNGLKFYTDGSVWSFVRNEGSNIYKLTDGVDTFNTVEVSQNGLTVSFGNISGGPTYTSFTFNA